MRRTALILGLAGAAGLLAAGPAAAESPGYPPVGQAVIISNASTGFYFTTDNQDENQPQIVQVLSTWPLVNGGSGSIWRLEHLSGDRYVIETEPIKNPAPACLTVPNNATGNVSPTVTACDGGPAQEWSVREDGTSETYTITPAGTNLRQWALTTQSQVYYNQDVAVSLRHFTGANAPTNMRWKIDATAVPSA